MPAENHVTSARDLGILARALIREFPEDDSYWHIHAIRYGGRVMHNYNSLLDRYPGADGMKTGFICASGYNLVASATRNGRRLIAIVLGAYSGAVRAQKAAALLERGFNSGGLSAGSRRRSAPSMRWRRSTRSRPICARRCAAVIAASRRRKTTTKKNKRTPARSPPAATAGSAQGLHAVEPEAADGKFVLGPPVDTEAAGRRVHRAGRPAGSGAEPGIRSEEEKQTRRRQEARWQDARAKSAASRPEKKGQLGQ